jgi:hypothetical protein
MFTLFRYGLVPIAGYCLMVVVFSIHIVWANGVQKRTWPETVATVMESKDFGQILSELRGTKNTFPDPHGVVRYVVDGKTYTWRGRARDIGLTVLNPGEQFKIFYNPERPQEINTLLLLGAQTGAMIVAGAFAFFSFYIWFFWLRRRSGRWTPPDDMGVDAARAFVSAPIIDNGPVTRTFSQGPRTTFGKR